MVDHLKRPKSSWVKQRREDEQEQEQDFCRIVRLSIEWGTGPHPHPLRTLGRKREAYCSSCPLKFPIPQKFPEP